MASQQFREKYRELRVERLRCIKEKVKEILDVDMSFSLSTADEFVNATPPDDDELERVESSILVNVDTLTEADSVASTVAPPPTLEREPTVIDYAEMATTTDDLNPETADASVGVSTETGTDAAVGTEMQTEADDNGDPPKIKAVPLEELAPAPTNDELFGDIAELQSLHKRQIQEFEELQENNKTRMEQGLQAKLRARKSVRRKAQIQKEQEEAQRDGHLKPPESSD